VECIVKLTLGSGRVKYFPLYHASRPNLWPIQPPVQLLLRAFSSRVKQVECEADCTHSDIAKVPLSARLYGFVYANSHNP
jgi:hypothetical protein